MSGTLPLPPVTSAPPGAPASPSVPGQASPFAPPISSGQNPPVPAPQNPAIPLASGAIPPSPPAGVNSPDYDSVVQDFAAQQKQRATGNLLAAKQVNPDHAAMAQTLASVLGVPAAAIQGDPQMWTDQFKARADNAVMAGDDNLQNWVAASPNNANVASDDIQQLGVFGRAAQEFKDATLSSQENQLEASVHAGIASPQQVDFLQTLKGELAARQQAEAGQKPAGLLGTLAADAGSFVQGIAGAAPDIAAGAAAGAARGALVGSVEPGGGTLLGAGAGALIGGGSGLIYGMAGNAAVDQYGQQMAATDGLTDRYGKPVSNLVRQSTALLSALAVGGLYTVGGEAAGPVIGDLATGMATRPALAAAVTKFAAGAIKGGLVNAAVNSGIGFTQAIAPQIVKAMASPDYKTAFNDPEARRQLVQGVLDNAESGLALGIGLHIPMAGTSFLGDALRADQASRAAAQWSQMQDAAGESKTRARAPDAFADLMRTYDGNGSIFVPGDRMAELYQGMQSHPGAPNDPFASFVPDMQAQMARAQLSGGDVEIPTADFTAKLAGTDIERQLRPDIRFAPDSFTLREAMDFKNSNMEPASLEGLTDEDAGDVGVDHRGEAIQAVKTDISDQLRRAGFTPDVAEQYATLLGERYGARGDDFAQSPLDLYKQEGIQVERGDQARVGPANYTGLDEVIDSLRRGDKQPTDKQLYGPSLLEYLTGGAATKRGAPGAALSGVGKREAAGGLKDETGDLAAMGADQWHRGQPGRRKLVNPDGMSLDEAAQRAHEAGYFPDHTETPDHNDLLGAVDEELRGNKRYVPAEGEALKKDQFRSVSQQLDQFLNEKDIDIKTASNAQVKAALDEEHKADATFEQAAEKTDTAEFKRWFGDSKVVDGDGKPLAVYHGTGGDIEAFDPAKRGSSTREADAKRGFFFSDNPKISEEYANEAGGNASIMPLYLSIKDPLVVDHEGKDYSPEAFSEYINQAEDGGHDGLIIKNAADGMFYGGETGTTYVAFKPEQIKSPFNKGDFDPSDRRVLHQPDGMGVRGSITLGDGQRIIRLFKGADKSTFLHEMGHQFLDEMLRDAERDDAPQSILDDAATVRKWLGMKDGQGPGVDEHEKWAAGFETYLMEGKAPSSALRLAFQKFAAWMTRIYRTVAGIGVPISDDIRGVMDRLLATDDAIAQARGGLALNPLFRNAKDAGMTVGEFAAYSGMIRKAENTQYDRVLRRAMRVEALKRKKEWRDAAAEARPEVEQTVKSRPALQAWYSLKYGKDILNPDNEVMSAKLNLAAARDILGNSFPRLPRDVVAADGIHPDALAPAFGYASGEAMLRDLVNENVGREEAAAQTGKPLSLNKYISKLVDQALDEHLEQKFGDPLNDGTLEEVAQEAAHNESQRDVLSAEIRQLAKLATGGGVKPPKSGFVRMFHGGGEYDGGSRWLTPYASYAEGYAKKSGGFVHYVDIPETDPNLVMIGDDGSPGFKGPYAHFDAPEDISKQLKPYESGEGAQPPYSVKQVEAWVRSNLADTAINKATRVAMYRRAEAQAGKDAERFLLSKKPIEAFKAKQRQMIAHAFATEADRLQKEWDKTTTYWRSIAKTATRPGTAQAFLDQVHGILDRLGMNVRRDPGEMDRGLKGSSLENFVADQITAGVPLQVPDFLQDASFNQHYQDLTADQFEAARDAVRGILVAGRRAEEVTIAGKREALQDVVDRIVDEASELPDREKVNKLATPGTIEGAMRSMAGNLRQGNAFLRKIEDLFRIMGGRETGTLLKTVFDPLKEAQHRGNDLKVEVSGMFSDLKGKLPAEWDKQDMKRQISVPELINRNTGKPEMFTRDRLLMMAMNAGNDSNLSKMEKGMGWTEGSAMPVLQRMLSKADWDFVQGTWDIFERYRPQIDEMQRRMTGVGMSLVEARPVETQHGIYRGGYFPVIYDASEAKTPDLGTRQDSPFDNDYYRATTSQGHTKGRTGYSAPLDFNLDGIPMKLGQMLHDLSHREAVMDAWKVLNHPEVANAFKNKLGKEYLDLMNPWLKDVARSSNVNDKLMGWSGKMLKYFRINASVAYIGLNPFTVMLHGTTAYLHSIGEAGAGEALKASKDLFDGTYNAKRNWDFVMQSSGEMRHREGQMDEDMRSSLKGMMGMEKKLKTAQDKAVAFGYYFIGKADLYSAGVAWLGKYRSLMGEGMDHDEATLEADRAVRMSHGSSSVLDKAAIFRSNEVMKSVASFGGFYNHIYNRVRDVAYTAQRGMRARASGDSVGARRDFADVLSKSFLYMLMPAMLGAGVRGYIQGQKPQDQGWLSYASESLAGEAAAMIPGVGSIASYIMGRSGGQLSFTPLTGQITTAIAAGRDIGHAITGAPVSDRWVEHAVQTAGVLTGIPGAGTLSKSGQYLWDIGDGEIDPQSISDFMKGILQGPPKGQ